MGLDMYLSARKRASNYRHAGPEENAIYKALLAAVGITPIDPDQGAPSCTISITVAYWRKANQIHGWFVDNVQGGKDECEEHHVTREQIQTLHDLCAKAVAEKNAALIQPRGGFFFGSTEIDEWYWKDLEFTVEQLNRVLKEHDESWEFYYRSSW